ncbi:cytidyltransferase-related domain protein [Methanothermus fervidus DSM 2088]|uniref:Multifunctional fusion protein n=1 Tax=Methanothermus fervidus (strain ATCC 43054 / DSM 2088 / JCM 10308 / V24 S) TaxID=523846 RepID=E3GWL3_METFV|nr:cytidyltransferase-related domain protein [Methanothermus fervidus DSM 2088]
MYRYVAVGGTFDKLHIGHKRLLQTAFKIGKKILIGVTSDEFASKKGSDVDPYNLRVKNLKKFLSKYKGRYELKKLNDRYGPTIYDEKIDAIVVSRETEATAHEINKIRKIKGMKKLDIIVIDMVLAEDGKPISSTRIRKGEIDKEGRLKKVKVVVGSKNPVKIQATKNIFKKIFKDREVVVDSKDVNSGVSPQPIGIEETITGAINRAKNAYSQEYNFSVGIEAGLVEVPKTITGFMDIQWCAIYNGEKVTLGASAGFEYPPFVIKKVMEGKEVGEIMEKFTGIKNLGEKEGAISYLSKGLLDRVENTEQCVLTAMIPWINRDYYLSSPR